MGIDEPRCIGRDITPDESRAIQVVEDPVDLPAHERKRTLAAGPVIASSARPLQDLAGIAVEPDIEPAREADAFKRGIFRQQMAQVGEQAVMVRVARRWSIRNTPGIVLGGRV